jgi:hypothetical protein
MIGRRGLFIYACADGADIMVLMAAFLLRFLFPFLRDGMTLMPAFNIGVPLSRGKGSA